MRGLVAALALIGGLAFATAGHAQAPEADAGLAGTWILTAEGRRGPAESKLVIRRTDDGYVGTTQREGRDARELRNIQTDGESFSFETTVKAIGMSIDLTYTGTLSGDSMSGVIDTPRDERPFTAVRRPGASDAGDAPAQQ